MHRSTRAMPHSVEKKIQARTCQKQTAVFLRDVTRSSDIHKARFWNVRDVKGIIVQDA